MMAVAFIMLKTGGVSILDGTFIIWQRLKQTKRGRLLDSMRLFEIE